MGLKDLGPPDLVHVIKTSALGGKHPKEVFNHQLVISSYIVSSAIATTLSRE